MPAWYDELGQGYRADDGPPELCSLCAGLTACHSEQLITYFRAFAEAYKACDGRGDTTLAIFPFAPCTAFYAD